MSTEVINPIYRITEKENTFGIMGTENTTGEEIEILPFTKDKNTAVELAKLLTEQKVSLCHARNVVADELIKNVIE